MPTLLIVHVTPGTVDTVQSALAADRYHVLGASSEAEMLRLLHEQGAGIDAVVVEWAPAESPTDGLLVQIREHEQLRHVEVLALAPQFDAERVEGAIDAGAFACLSPPYSPSQLRAAIESAVSSCELARDLDGCIAGAAESLGLLQEASFSFRTPGQADVLSRHLGAACPDPQMAIGVLELMLNAVEHGNLGITYEEKSALLKAGAFRTEVARRLELPEYRDRRVRVSVQRRAAGLHLTITDEGAGFDFTEFLTPSRERIFDPNGRGVMLANAALEIEYKPPGNRVEVSLPLASRSSVRADSAAGPQEPPRL